MRMGAFVPRRQRGRPGGTAWQAVGLYVLAASVALVAAAPLGRRAALPAVAPAADRPVAPGLGDSALGWLVRSAFGPAAAASAAPSPALAALRYLAGIDAPTPAGLFGAAGLPAGPGPTTPGRTIVPGTRPPAPPGAAHPDNARPPVPVPPPPDLYGSRPVVGVYHTDSTEAYRPALRRVAREAGTPYSRDQGLGVVQVGAVLCRDLYRLGVGCAHSRAVNDPDGLLGAYANSRRTAAALIARFPSLRVLLDVQRSAAPEVARGAAPVALVVGTADRLPEPHWRQNLAFARRLAAAALRLDPSWHVTVQVSENQYNQELAPGCLLVQVGGTDTSLAAADLAAARLARALADLAAADLLPPAPKA